MKTLKKLSLYILLILFGLLLFAYLYVGVYLPNPEPPRDLRVELTEEKIERGKYLAMHVSACMDCHAVRDWSRFTAPPFPESIGAGGDRFGRDMGLPGEVFARNLTPPNLDKYTDGELFRVITTGVNHEKKVLFPIMPFEAYSKMAEEDVIAIIAFLRSLEPREGDYPDAELDFPVNILINTMSHKYVGPQKRPLRSDSLAYGKYITTIAACSDCHFPGTISSPDFSRPFAGGMAFDMPGYRIQSANLTPDQETGIGNWTKEMFIQRFKSFDPEVHTPQPVEAGQFNTMMPWTMYAGMTDDDLGAIYDYLMTLKPIRNQVVRYQPLP